MNWTLFLWVVTVVLAIVAIVSIMRKREEAPKLYQVLAALFLGATLIVSNTSWWGIMLVFLVLTFGVEFFQSRIRMRIGKWASALGAIQALFAIEAAIAVFMTMGNSISSFSLSGWVEFMAWTGNILITLIVMIIMAILCANDESPDAMTALAD